MKIDTYNTREFENLINEILSQTDFDVNIKIMELQNQQAKKWYDKTYIDCDVIEGGKRYGIYYDDMIQYDYKAVKIENLLKSFLLSFSRNYKHFELVDGYIKQVNDKDSTLEHIIAKNQNRVYRGLFYTTLYGIGFWSIFASKRDIEVAKDLAQYLQSKKIDYINEWSDAHWVYRFKINKEVELHNKLLSEFKINN